MGAGVAAPVELVRFGYSDAGDVADAGSRATREAMAWVLVNSSGRSLHFTYDAEGRMGSWADRNGTEYRYTYDAAGRCVTTAGTDGS